MQANKSETWSRVQERYSKAAVSGECCETGCCDGLYTAEELARVPVGSFLGLGSGNPVRHARLEPGEVVLDLGSGRGIDVFLAARMVGPTGRAVGVDMTPSMVDRARQIAREARIGNVEFHKGPIEALPLPDASVDVIVSNCVINLSPDKSATFREAFRVLSPGGRMVVSDVVQERPLALSADDCGCVATAMLRADYLATIRTAGFRNVEIVEDRPWRVGLGSLEASAITLRAWKPQREVTQ